VKYLLDTNVLSEARRREGNTGVKAWMAEAPDEALHVSVVTLGEIRKGIEGLRPRDPDTAAVFEAWLVTLDAVFSERVMLVDRAVADRWGRVLAACPGLPVEDALLAATALVHGMTLVSRNEKHLAPTGVLLVNPWR
jgi:predicted nucleic acid-binding protein